MRDPFAEDPLARQLLGLPKPKADCTCGHPHAMHMVGPCALNRGQVPGSCWCDGYEPADDCRASFPVEVLEQPKDK